MTLSVSLWFINENASRIQAGVSGMKPGEVTTVLLQKRAGAGYDILLACSMQWAAVLPNVRFILIVVKDNSRSAVDIKLQPRNQNIQCCFRG